MSGWYKMHRGWMTDSLFGNEPFCKRAAWEYLIQEAAFEDHTQWFNGKQIEVKRGQFVVSERRLSEVWKWDRQRVRTFLKLLERDGKVTRDLTHGATHLNIRNYERFQGSTTSDKPSQQPTTNPELTQDKPTTEEGKERKEGKEPSYAFAGRVIRLNRSDFDQWAKTFHGIPDMTAELTGLDAWLQKQPEAQRKQWFHSVPGMLSKKHQEAMRAAIPKAQAPPELATPC